QAPFSFPALAGEGDRVAFLEPEPAEGGTDKNGDDDATDTILRAFRQTSATAATDATGGRSLAADAATVLDGRSLALSGGQLFFRQPRPRARRGRPGASAWRRHGSPTGRPGS